VYGHALAAHLLAALCPLFTCRAAAPPSAAALPALAVLRAQQAVVDDARVGQDCAGAAAGDAGATRWLAWGARALPRL
jgi:hypothetical protein